MPRPHKQTSIVVDSVINEHIDEIREHSKGVVDVILHKLQEQNITITKSAIWNRIHKYRVANGLPVSKHTRRNIPECVFVTAERHDEPVKI